MAGQSKLTGSSGFTIVELITAIILLAVLSGVAMSNFVSPSAFAPATLTHQLKLESDLAQSMATARQDTTTQFEVFADTSNWRLRTSNSLEGVIRDTAVEAYNSTITVSDSLVTVPLSAVEILLINYSGRGEITTAAVGATPLDPSLGLQFDLVGDSTRTLCLYPTGHLDAHPCS